MTTFTPAKLARVVLPIGMSFIGTRWSEPEVLSLAYAFEQLTHERRPPQYLPTTGS